MRKLADGIYQWSIFSEEKQLDFNGLYLTLDAGAVLIDPPPLSSEDIAQIEELGVPTAIILTNKDHRRHAPQARDRFDTHIWIHENDRSLVDCECDHSYNDDTILYQALHVIRVPNSKSPGESALYWKAKKTLILGDSLIGKPAGRLSLLPDDKFADPGKARIGVGVLSDCEVDRILVGDGNSILEGADRVLKDAIRNYR